MLPRVPKVLVVDDSRLDSQILSGILRKEGFEVSTAANGADGFKRAVSDQPDIILLDVVMPDESGFETCSRLKKEWRTNAIPIIFLSGSEDMDSRVRGLTNGGVDYITKPFDRDELLARLRIHVRIRDAFLALIERQRSELHDLAEAQKAILVQPDEMPDARFEVYYRPAYEAGGDFYDVIQLGDGIYGYFTADICGHGLGAALATSAVKAMLRQNASLLYTPVETMTLMNAVLRPALGDESPLSACYARLNRQMGTLQIVSAGHPPLMHIKPDGAIEVVQTIGDLLCAFESPTFETREIIVKPGDRLLMFSDGLIESIRGTTVSRNVGVKNLLELTQLFGGASMPDLLKGVAQSICPPAQHPDDDMLLLGITV